MLTANQACDGPKSSASIVMVFLATEMTGQLLPKQPEVQSVWSVDPALDEDGRAMAQKTATWLSSKGRRRRRN